MLDRFSIENFKGYEGRYIFDFPGLTYLTGANNSGKSTIIQAIYMLATSNSNNYNPTLLANTVNYHFGDFSNMLNKNCSITERISFELSFKNISIAVNYANSESDSYSPIIDQITFSSNRKNDNKFFSFESENRNNRFSLSINDMSYASNIRINGLTPDFSSIIIKKSDYLRDFVLLRAVLQQNLQCNCIKYLRAYREDAKPVYQLQGALNRNIGITGEYTAEAIYRMYQGNNYISFEDNMLFKDALQLWFKKIIGDTYSLEVDNPEKMLRMRVIEEISSADNITKQKFDVTDVGFGFSQVIPIITLILLSKKGDVLLIENPEVHLHPKLQANLADLFLYAVNNGRKLIIETHSEYIINRTRYLVKKSTETLSDKINIYFSEKVFAEGDSFIHNQEISIDDAGQLSNWPEDFFDQSYIENIRLLT